MSTDPGDLPATTTAGEGVSSSSDLSISTIAVSGTLTVFLDVTTTPSPRQSPTLPTQDVPSVVSSYSTTVTIRDGTTVVNSIPTSSLIITSTTATPSSPTAEATTKPSSGSSGSNNPVTEAGSGGGLSTGAIAGIAVGAVAIVAAIAAFFIWKFCVGRRRSRDRSAAYGEARVGTPGTSAPNSIEKGAPLVGAIAPVYRDSGSAGSENQLPQQADDATVQSRFATIYDQIELHAENFYKDASPMIPPAIEGALSRYDTPLLGAPLAARLEESPRATTILKHVLSYEISTTVVDPTSSSGRRSLLPTPLLALLQEVQSQQPSQQAGRRGVPGSAYSRLKQLAASYRSSPQSMPSNTSSATRESALHFTQTFALWADPQYDETRRTQHLTEVLDSAIKFSVWLLSQPETFELRWDGSAAASSDKETTGSGSGEHTLVTIPALVKVTSGGGAQRLSRNQEKTLCKLVKRPI